MSNQVKYKVAIPGEASTGADSLFDDLATKSQIINEDNTRTEWVSTKHVAFADKPTVLFRTARENLSPTGTTYSGVTYQTVAHGSAGSTEITFAGVAMAAGDVLRFNWSWRTSQQTGALATGAAVKGSDFWWIQLQILVDTGAGAAWRDVGFPMRNSLSSNRSATSGQFPLSGFRMYSGTFCEIATGAQTVTGIRAQVKAEVAAGAITIAEWNLSFKIIGA